MLRSKLCGLVLAHFRPCELDRLVHWDEMGERIFIIRPV